MGKKDSNLRARGPGTVENFAGAPTHRGIRDPGRRRKSGRRKGGFRSKSPGTGPTPTPGEGSTYPVSGPARGSRTPPTGNRLRCGARGSMSHTGMFYQGGVGYLDEGSSHPPEDHVLDLSLRKQERESAYLGNSEEFFRAYHGEREVLRVRSPEELLQRGEQDCGPNRMAKERMCPNERLHQALGSPSPNSCPPFSTDSILQRQPPTPRPSPITTITSRNGKPTRPFKAYPKDFLALATSTEDLLDDSQKRFMEFRKQCLDQLHATAGPTSNKNMKRPVQSDSPNQLPSSSGDARDQAYWERRKKNNEAAKKSRDARRAKEDELAIRAAFLEQENVQLKMAYASLRSKFDRLYSMMYATS